MLERLKSPASVCVVGDPCAESIGKASVVSAARTGDQVYNAACAGCHISGAAGAPKTGDAGAWASRLDKEWTLSLSMLWRAITQCQRVDFARTALIRIADAVAFMVGCALAIQFVRSHVGLLMSCRNPP